MNRKQRNMLIRIVIAAAMTIALQLSALGGWPLLTFYLLTYAVIGHDILLNALKGMRNGRLFDENFLMTVATLGAFALAVYERSDDYLEAIAVMLFYQVGELFQSYAVGRSRRNISALMDIRPDYANVEAAPGSSVAGLIRISPDDVETGDTIFVLPGEKVPIDGVVTAGTSSVNTVALTGESLPREVRPGDEILSGSINMTGVLTIRTTKEFGESTVSKILELVEDSASHKSKSEDFIARFARVYTPAVCFSALALALLPPLALALMGAQPWVFATFETWIYRAMVFLVISCPCALVISIPLSFFAGIGAASRAGILVKGANILESLAKVRTVAFDKTGTLTLGVFEVNAMHDDGCRDLQAEADRLVELVAMTESASSHPISRSLRRAYGKEIDHSRIADIRETSGHGVTATIDGSTVCVGNEKMMQTLGICPPHCHHVGTIVHVAIDGSYAGHIVMGDVVKPHARQAVEELRRKGVANVVMFTGDTEAVARNVADTLGINDVYSQLLPSDKVALLERLIAEKKKGKVAFVGDGINDAPVLTRADIGIAMGGVGSDAAIEAADIVLMEDSPLQIASAIGISRKTLGIVWQNIVMALGIKLACLLLGAFGVAGMWLAIFADVGVMILAVLNAIRAMFYRP